MPIDYTVNHENKCIYTHCSGLMDIEDFEQYFSQIWSDATHYGYNELFDARDAEWKRFDFSLLPGAIVPQLGWICKGLNFWLIPP